MPYDEQDFQDPDCCTCNDEERICLDCEFPPNDCVCRIKEFSPCPRCQDECAQCSDIYTTCEVCDKPPEDCYCVGGSKGDQLPCTECVTDLHGQAVRS